MECAQPHEVPSVLPGRLDMGMFGTAISLSYSKTARNCTIRGDRLQNVAKKYRRSIVEVGMYVRRCLPHWF